jgi:hypothetical protein
MAGLQIVLCCMKRQLIETEDEGFDEHHESQSSS